VATHYLEIRHNLHWSGFNTAMFAFFIWIKIYYNSRIYLLFHLLLTSVVISCHCWKFVFVSDKRTEEEEEGWIKSFICGFCGINDGEHTDDKDHVSRHVDK